MQALLAPNSERYLPGWLIFAFAISLPWLCRYAVLGFLKINLNNNRDERAEGGTRECRQIIFDSSKQ